MSPLERDVSVELLLRLLNGVLGRAVLQRRLQSGLRVRGAVRVGNQTSSPPRVVLPGVQLPELQSRDGQRRDT